MVNSGSEGESRRAAADYMQVKSGGSSTSTTTTTGEGSQQSQSPITASGGAATTPRKSDSTLTADVNNDDDVPLRETRAAAAVVEPPNDLSNCRPTAGVLCRVPLDKVQGVLKKPITPPPPPLPVVLETPPKATLASRKVLCLYCDRTFVSASLRQKHVERSHSTKQFRRVSSRRQQNHFTSTPCVYCDKLTATEHTLKELFEHLILNHSQRYYGCLPCEDRFLNTALLAEHNASAHRIFPEATVVAPAKPLPTSTPETAPSKAASDEAADDVPVKMTRSMRQRKEMIAEAKPASKIMKKLLSKDLRGSKKLTVKSSALALKRSKRLQAKVMVETSAARRQRRAKNSSGDGKRSLDHHHHHQQLQTSGMASGSGISGSFGLIEKSLKAQATVNPYPEFDSFFRVKKITDHSIDNLKISSLTFDDVFDKAFFNRIRSNIQENLLHHIDGKLFKNEESESRISNFEKNSSPQEVTSSNLENYGCELSLNAVTPAVSLLSTQQFGEDLESQIEYGAKPASKKAKQQTKSGADQEVVHYKYFTRRKYQASILEHKENRDLSKLDMWTQYVIKNRQQKIIDDKKTADEVRDYVSGEEYKTKVRRDELNRILDRRGPFEDLREEASKKAAMDKLSEAGNDVNEESFSEIRELLTSMVNKVFEMVEESSSSVEDESDAPFNQASDRRQIPSYLNLRHTSTLENDSEIDRSDRIALICSSQETENFELPSNTVRGKNEKVELTGEWARSRIFVCAACGLKLQNMKQLLEHKNIYHQYVWVQHYELVGNQSELYRHLSIPGLGKVGVLEDNVQCKLWKRSEARLCSKCGKQCNSLGELHRHILECGGDWTWMLARKKCKYRPFGAKSRRKRRGLVKRIYTQKTEPSEKKIYKKAFDGPRPKPSDAETIQRMLANLPPKRATRKIVCLKDGLTRNTKQKQQQQNPQATNQAKLKCGKVIHNSRVNNTENKNSQNKEYKVKNNFKRSLRSLNKVLASRVLDTNSTLLLKRKLKSMNTRQTRQSKVIVEREEESNEEESDVVVAEEKMTAITEEETPPEVTPSKVAIAKKKKKTEMEQEQKEVEIERRTSPRNEKNATPAELLPEPAAKAEKMNIKRFFPVRKKKSSQKSGDDAEKSAKRNKSETKADIKQSGEPAKVKKSTFSSLMRTLSLRKKKTESKNKNKVVEASAPKETEMKRKRKFGDSFRNAVKKIKKLKVGHDNEKPTETPVHFLEETKTGTVLPTELEKIVIPVIEEPEKISDPDVGNTPTPVPIVVNCSDGPAISGTIFDLHNENMVQAKGVEFDTLKVDTKLDESVKPQSSPIMVSPKPNKGKIIRKQKGLNDCIAMLTSKLNQSVEKSSSINSIFNLMPSTKEPERQWPTQEPERQWSTQEPERQWSTKEPERQCILKVPSIKDHLKLTSPTVEEDTALDLSCHSHQPPQQLLPVDNTSVVKVVEDLPCEPKINIETAAEVEFSKTQYPDEAPEIEAAVALEVPDVEPSDLTTVSQETRKIGSSRKTRSKKTPSPPAVVLEIPKVIIPQKIVDLPAIEPENIICEDDQQELIQKKPKNRKIGQKRNKLAKRKSDDLLASKIDNLIAVEIKQRNGERTQPKLFLETNLDSVFNTREVSLDVLNKPERDDVLNEPLMLENKPILSNKDDLGNSRLDIVLDSEDELPLSSLLKIDGESLSAISEQEVDLTKKSKTKRKKPAFKTSTTKSALLEKCMREKMLQLSGELHYCQDLMEEIENEIRRENDLQAMVQAETEDIPIPTIFDSVLGPENLKSAFEDRPDVENIIAAKVKNTKKKEKSTKNNADISLEYKASEATEHTQVQDLNVNDFTETGDQAVDQDQEPKKAETTKANGEIKGNNHEEPANGRRRMARTAKAKALENIFDDALALAELTESERNRELFQGSKKKDRAPKKSPTRKNKKREEPAETLPGLVDTSSGLVEASPEADEALPPLSGVLPDQHVVTNEEAVMEDGAKSPQKDEKEQELPHMLSTDKPVIVVETVTKIKSKKSRKGKKQSKSPKKAPAQKNQVLHEAFPEPHEPLPELHEPLPAVREPLPELSDPLPGIKITHALLDVHGALSQPNETLSEFNGALPPIAGMLPSQNSETNQERILENESPQRNKNHQDLFPMPHTDEKIVELGNLPEFKSNKSRKGTKQSKSPKKLSARKNKKALLEALPELHEPLLEVCEQLPEVREPLPEVREPLPEIREPLSEVQEVLPKIQATLLEVHEALPQLHEVLTPFAEMLPSQTLVTNQGTILEDEAKSPLKNKNDQDLPPKPHTDEKIVELGNLTEFKSNKSRKGKKQSKSPKTSTRKNEKALNATFPELHAPLLEVREPLPEAHEPLPQVQEVLPKIHAALLEVHEALPQMHEVLTPLAEMLPSQNSVTNQAAIQEDEAKSPQKNKNNQDLPSKPHTEEKIVELGNLPVFKTNKSRKGKKQSKSPKTLTARKNKKAINKALPEVREPLPEAHEPLPQLHEAFPPFAEMLPSQYSVVNQEAILEDEAKSLQRNMNDQDLPPKPHTEEKIEELGNLPEFKSNKSRKAKKQSKSPKKSPARKNKKALHEALPEVHVPLALHEALPEVHMPFLEVREPFLKVREHLPEAGEPLPEARELLPHVQEVSPKIHAALLQVNETLPQLREDFPPFAEMLPSQCSVANQKAILEDETKSSQRNKNDQDLPLKPHTDEKIVELGNSTEFKSSKSKAKKQSKSPKKSSARKNKKALHEPLPEAREPLPESVREPLPEEREPLPEVREPLPEVREPLLEVLEPLPEVREPLPEVQEPLSEAFEPLPQVQEVLPQLHETLFKFSEALPPFSSKNSVAKREAILEYEAKSPQRNKNDQDLPRKLHTDEKMVELGNLPEFKSIQSRKGKKQPTVAAEVELISSVFPTTDAQVAVDNVKSSKAKSRKTQKNKKQILPAVCLPAVCLPAHLAHPVEVEKEPGLPSVAQIPAEVAINPPESKSKKSKNKKQQPALSAEVESVQPTTPVSEIPKDDDMKPLEVKSKKETRKNKKEIIPFEVEYEPVVPSGAQVTVEVEMKQSELKSKAKKRPVALLEPQPLLPIEVPVNDHVTSLGGKSKKNKKNKKTALPVILEPDCIRVEKAIEVVEITSSDKIDVPLLEVEAEIEGAVEDVDKVPIKAKKSPAKKGKKFTQMIPIIGNEEIQTKLLSSSTQESAVEIVKKSKKSPSKNKKTHKSSTSVELERKDNLDESSKWLEFAVQGSSLELPPEKQLLDYIDDTSKSSSLDSKSTKSPSRKNKKKQYSPSGVELTLVEPLIVAPIVQDCFPPKPLEEETSETPVIDVTPKRITRRSTISLSEENAEGVQPSIELISVTDESAEFILEGCLKRDRKPEMDKKTKQAPRPKKKNKLEEIVSLPTETSQTTEKSVAYEVVSEESRNLVTLLKSLESGKNEVAIPGDDDEISKTSVELGKKSKSPTRKLRKFETIELSKSYEFEDEIQDLEIDEISPTPSLDSGKKLNKSPNKKNKKESALELELGGDVSVSDDETRDGASKPLILGKNPKRSPNKNKTERTDPFEFEDDSREGSNTTKIDATTSNSDSSKKLKKSPKKNKNQPVEVPDPFEFEDNDKEIGDSTLNETSSTSSLDASKKSWESPSENNAKESVELPKALEDTAISLPDEEISQNLEKPEILDESLKRKSPDDEIESPHELRRSKRHSRKVPSYNETELAEQALEVVALEKVVVFEKAVDLTVQPEEPKEKPKMNSDELFDLLKATPNENHLLPKPPVNTFFNNFDEISDDFNDDNFDMFENILEKSMAVIEENLAADRSLPVLEMNLERDDVSICEPLPLESELERPVTPKDIDIQLQEKLLGEEIESKLDSLAPADAVPKPSKKNSKKNKKKKSDKVVHCEICDRSFRIDNLNKHQRTLVHISKLSEIEAREAELKAKNRSEDVVEITSDSSKNDLNLFEVLDNIESASKDDDGRESPASFTINNQSLKLADIIDDVLNKPSLSKDDEKHSFSDIIMQNPDQPEIRRYKSLGERKSFDADQPQIVPKDPPPPPQAPQPKLDYFTSSRSNEAGTILEKQLTLLQNMIENRTNLSYIDDISISSAQSENNSLVEVESIKQNESLYSNAVLKSDSFLKPTQYEEISEDSTNLRSYDDQKSRKALNRDEELFLECCSLLKSSSEVSNYSKKSNKLAKVLNNLDLKSAEEPDWLENKSFSRSADNFQDSSRIPTPLGDNFVDDESNSNTIASNWNMTYEGDKDKPAEGSAVASRSFSFEEVLNDDDDDKAKDKKVVSKFGGVISKALHSFKSKKRGKKRNGIISDDESSSSMDLDINKRTTAEDLSDSSTTDSKKMLTKGAMKVFEGLKVSIPTEELNMKEVLNNCISQPSKNPQQQKSTIAATTTTTTTVIKNPTKKLKLSTLSTELFSRITNKKKPTAKISKKKSIDIDALKVVHDVYDFEETQDNSDVFAKPDFRSFRNKKTEEPSKAASDVEDGGDSLSFEAASSTSSVSELAPKKSKSEQNITKKKCMIMGRIFKNAAAKSRIEEEIREIPTADSIQLVEDFVRNCPKPAEDAQKKPKMTEEEMNKAFDMLLNGEANAVEKPPPPPPAETKPVENQKKKSKVKYKKRSRGNADDETDDEFSLSKLTKKRTHRKNEDNCINLEQELKECIGVASRKSQRKCTSGKQNVLVEYWSSDESTFEIPEPAVPKTTEKEITFTDFVKPFDLIEKPVEKVSEPIVDEIIEQEVAKTTPEIKTKPKKSKPRDASENSATGASSNRRKRAAANPLYHWSSSSEDESSDLILVKPIRDETEDDDDRPIQHGWIVGDSPKKLVTMLAQAKGKKLGDVDSVKEQGKKRTTAYS